MYFSCQLTKVFLLLNRHCRPYIKHSIGPFSRLSDLCNCLINEQHASSRTFTTSALAHVKSVHKFGRKIREALIAKEKLKMSGDAALAPLQAAVKEKVRRGSTNVIIDM